MSERHRLVRMRRLLELRKREVEALSAEMSSERAVQRRYLENLARLEHLCVSSGASGAQLHTERPHVTSATLSLNCAGYKQAVMEMAAVHRLDLSLHEAQMANTQQRMGTAARRHASLEQVLARRRRSFARQQLRQDQRRQDDLAAQVWLRRSK